MENSKTPKEDKNPLGFDKIQLDNHENKNSKLSNSTDEVDKITEKISEITIDIFKTSNYYNIEQPNVFPTCNHQHHHKYSSSSDDTNYEEDEEVRTKMIGFTSLGNSYNKIRPGDRYEDKINEGYSSLNYPNSHFPAPGVPFYYDDHHLRHPISSFHHHSHLYRQVDFTKKDFFSDDGPLEELVIEHPSFPFPNEQPIDLIDSPSSGNTESVSSFDPPLSCVAVGVSAGSGANGGINSVGTIATTSGGGGGGGLPGLSTTRINDNQNSSRNRVSSQGSVQSSGSPPATESHQSMYLINSTVFSEAQKLENVLKKLKKQYNLDSENILHELVDKMYNRKRIVHLPKIKLQAILHYWKKNQRTTPPGIPYQNVCDSNGCSIVIKLIDQQDLENLIMFLSVGPDLHVIAALPSNPQGYRGSVIHHGILSANPDLIGALVKHIRIHSEGRNLSEFTESRDSNNMPPMALAVSIVNQENVENLCQIIHLLLEIISPFNRVIEKDHDTSNSRALDSFAIAAKSIFAPRILRILLESLIVDFTKIRLWWKYSYDNLIEELMKRCYGIDESKNLVQLVYENTFIQADEQTKLADYIRDLFLRNLPID